MYPFRDFLRRSVVDYDLVDINDREALLANRPVDFDRFDKHPAVEFPNGQVIFNPTLEELAEGSFKEILDETRHPLALAYLSAPRHSVSDITQLLGFSAASCFTRAFRRWTGQSPTDWRSAAARHGNIRPVVPLSLNS